MSERFTINYRDGAYKVSTPNYDGGEVVRAEVFDKQSALLAQMAAALESIRTDHANNVYQMGEGRVRRALCDVYDVAGKALAAYAASSPDPVYKEAKALQSVAEKVLGEWREGYGLRCIDELRATINRARGEG